MHIPLSPHYFLTSLNHVYFMLTSWSVLCSARPPPTQLVTLGLLVSRDAPPRSWLEPWNHPFQKAGRTTYDRAQIRKDGPYDLLCKRTSLPPPLFSHILHIHTPPTPLHNTHTLAPVLPSLGLCLGARGYCSQRIHV